MMSRAAARLTTPDLTLLSLLMEKDGHGYELNAELERREVRDWAGVSRPQVYYSLRKLAETGMIEPAENATAGAGPERQVYRITAKGREGLILALARDEWATQQALPPFLTWLALSPHADRETVETMISRRENFLEEQLRREREHLLVISGMTGESAAVADLMVSHKITQSQSELRWLQEVRQRLLI